MADWLLSVPYLLAGIGFIFISWTAGGYGHSQVCSQRSYVSNPWFLHAPGAGLYFLVVRIAVGLALISWTGALAGVAGYFRGSVILPLLLPVIVIGLPVGHYFGMRHRPMLLRDRFEVSYMWTTSPLAEKIAGALVALVVCAMVYTICIGALVPDMNHDPMWYHLSVPQQWTFSGRFDVLPDVMPSAYPLAVESLYALLLLLKPDPVLCSVLTAFSGVLLLVAMAGAVMITTAGNAGCGLRGWGLAAVVAGWFPLISVYGLAAPIQPKNDVVTMLWTFCGLTLIWLPLLHNRSLPGISWWAVSGFLIGTACSAKPPVVLISAIALAFALIGYIILEVRLQRKWPGRTITGSAWGLCFALLAMSPWMVRGWQSHGLPLFPLGRDVFPVAQEYKPLFQAFFRLHDFRESVSPGLLTEIAQQPSRLIWSSINGERCIGLYILLCIAGLAVLRGYWRLYAAMLASQMAMFIVIMEGEVVFRLFAPVYCLAAPAVACVTGFSVKPIPRARRLLFGSVILVVLLSSAALQHYRYANFKTMKWKFRPVLSEVSVRQYAEHAERGVWKLIFDNLQDLIGPDERVLLLHCPYPFYLHRDTLWNDEVVEVGGLADRWQSASTEQADALLRREAIDVILSAGLPPGEVHPQPTEKSLLDRNKIVRVGLPDHLVAQNVALYRVVHAKRKDTDEKL